LPATPSFLPKRSRHREHPLGGTLEILEYKLNFLKAPSSTWGSFARANPYYMIAPLSEEANRVTGGLDYTRGGWNVHYHIGYQKFEHAVNGGNVTSPERSINVNDPTTAPELLVGASWIDSRKLTTPVSEFSYTGSLFSKLQTRGGYIFYRYQGPAALNMSFDGIARTNAAGLTFKNRE
jgi:hypothetical protein